MRCTRILIHSNICTRCAKDRVSVAETQTVFLRSRSSSFRRTTARDRGDCVWGSKCCQITKHRNASCATLTLDWSGCFHSPRRHNVGQTRVPGVPAGSKKDLFHCDLKKTAERKARESSWRIGTKKSSLRRDGGQRDTELWGQRSRCIEGFQMTVMLGGHFIFLVLF